jgi:hypothetical protein
LRVRRVPERVRERRAGDEGGRSAENAAPIGRADGFVGGARVACGAAVHQSIGRWAGTSVVGHVLSRL